MNATPVTFALLIVTERFAGVNVSPALLGVTVKLPFDSPVKLKLPEPSAVVVAFAAPLSVTVEPLPPVIVPEILYVWAVVVNATPVMLALLIVTERFAGVNVKPVLLGVTV